MKKTTNRILSVALAILMAFSCITVAFAADEDTKTNDFSYSPRGISEFLTNTGCVTYLANMLDELLKENAEKDKDHGKLEVGSDIAEAVKEFSTTAYSGVNALPLGKKLFSLTIDYTSIDAIMQTADDIFDIYNSGVVGILKLGLGDLKDFQFNGDNWKKDYRRAGGDQRIFEQIINLVCTNSGLIKKFIIGGIDKDKGGIDVGSILNGVFTDEDKQELSIDFYAMIKDALAGALYPYNPDKPEETAAFKADYERVYAKKIDNIVFEDVIPDLLTGDGEVFDGVEITQNDSIDKVLINIFNVCWAKYIIPALNKVKIEYDENNDLARAFKNVINFDFSTLDFSDIPAISGTKFIDGINNILGAVIKKIVKASGLTWANGGFDKLGENVTNLFTFLIDKGEFAETKYANEAAAAKAATGIEPKALIVVKAVLSEVGDDYGTEVQSCKSLKEMAFVVLKKVVKDELGLEVTYKKGADYLDVAADLLAYVADKVIPMGDKVKVGAGAELEDVINYIANFLLFDRGFAKMLNLNVSKTDSAYKKLNSILWIFYSSATPEAKRIDSETLLKGKDGKKSIFESILSLDIQNILNITVKTLLDSLTSYTASKLVYSVVKNVLDNLFGQQIVVAYANTAPFDNAFSNKSIATIVDNLLTALNKNRAALISTGCYTACLVLDIPAADWVISSGEAYDDGTTSVKLTGTEPDGKTKINRVLYSGKDYTAEKETGIVKGINSYEGSYYGVSFAEKKAPAKATGVKATVTDKTAALTWTAAAGATGYAVMNGTTKVADVTATKYTVTGLKANTKYSTYSVVAYTKTANGKVFNADAAAVTFTTAPAAVTGVKASKTTETAITLTWTKTSGATSYSVYNTVTKKTVTTKTNTVTITGLKANTAYTFNITSVGGTKGGVTAFKANTLPAAVTGVKVSAVTATTAKVTWTKVTGATAYTVYDAASKKVLAKVKTNSASLTKLSAAKTYKVQVSATVGSLTGAYSAAKSFTTLFTQVTGVKVSKVTATSIALKWSTVKGATSYKVYVNGKAAATVKKATATVSKLKAGTVYSIYVVALKSKTVGQASATIKVGTTPAKVTGLKAAASTKLFNKEVKLTWKTVKGATGYNVYQGSKLIGTTTKATYTVSKLDKKTTYTFKVEPIIKTADYTTKGAQVSVKG